MNELLTGKGGNVRAARVEVTSSRGKHLFRRPIQHLVPLEIRANFSDLHKQPQAKDAQAQAQENSTPEVATIITQLMPQRKDPNVTLLSLVSCVDGMVSSSNGPYRN